MSERRARRVLIGLELVMGLVAVGCGWLLITGRADRLRIDPDLLDDTPFHSFAIPGVILAFGVGGTNLLGALGLLMRRTWGGTATLCAGFVLMGWMIGQVILLGIQGPKWQQPFYLLWGLVTAVLAWRSGIRQPAGFSRNRAGNEEWISAGWK